MTDPRRFDDLPDEIKDFLINLRPDEVKTLAEGIRLVNAVHTVGAFVKWLIVGIVGIFFGVVMLGESIAKVVAWFRPPP